MELNIESLQSKNNKINSLREKTYEQVKKQCYNRVKIISKTGKEYCWYTIPKIILGYPPINIKECSEYLINKLNKESVRYTFFTPNLFYIYWSEL